MLFAAIIKNKEDRKETYYLVRAVNLNYAINMLEMKFWSMYRDNFEYDIFDEDVSNEAMIQIKHPILKFSLSMGVLKISETIFKQIISDHYKLSGVCDTNDFITVRKAFKQPITAKKEK